MVYYFISERASAVTCSAAYALMGALHRLGVRVVAATVNGAASTATMTSVPVAYREEMLVAIRPGDTAFCCDAGDAEQLLSTPVARVVYHDADQEAEPPVQSQNRLDTLATLDSGRGLPFTGPLASAHFFYRSEQKFEEVVAHGPFHDEGEARAVYAASPAAEFIEVGHHHELETAKRLKQASVYIRTPADDALGWHALSAMAAGCVVLTAPPSVGISHLVPNRTCWVSEEPGLAQPLAWLMKPEQAALRFSLRHRALAVAHAHNETALTRRVAGLLNTELVFLLS